MSTITLDLIKFEQNRVAEMIAAFEAQAKMRSTFPCTVSFPELAAGERYVGAIISADGSKRDHIILLPDQLENADWKSAMAWAKSIGGELPDRTESALMFSVMKDEFKQEWHWLREQHASYSDYAWMQYFDYGTQRYYRKSYEYRARAVRRLKIL